MGYFTGIKFLFDPLSIFFLVVIAIVSIPALIYSIGYLKGHYSRFRIAECQVLTVLFILLMAAVVTVGNVFAFLIFWELMSLVSYFLVVFEREREQAVRAGTIYIVMTHIGTAFLAAAFLLMYKYSNSFDFSAVKLACQGMPQDIRNTIFMFLLIGFGTKAGVVPVHIWLPYAHPEAPSHISSLMSGVMIKTAIYGFLRFVVFILRVKYLWWGGLVLVIAVISSLVGIIYALMEHDIKKILAYSSVENMGLILLGIGAAMVFIGLGMNTWAVLALAAGLYHLINHAIFKGLLFLCAGSVYKVTGTRDIEKLGGLIRKMPQTAVFFLIGAMGISALPPLNGFISEWLLLQSFFLGSLQASGNVKVFLVLCAAMLIFTSALAAVCFVKAFGITFLGLGRSRTYPKTNRREEGAFIQAETRSKDAGVVNALRQGRATQSQVEEMPLLPARGFGIGSELTEKVKESAFSMRAGMFILSSLVIVFGLCAGVIIKLLTIVSGSTSGLDVSKMSFSLNNFTLSPKEGSSVYLSSPLIMGIIILVILAALVILGRRKFRVYRTWDCGYYSLTARNQYSAIGFSKPFQIAFSFFLLPYRRTQKIRESFYYVKSFIYETRTRSVFKKYIYLPILNLVFMSAKYLRRIQPGSIHFYIAYIFITLVLVIVFRGRF